MPSGAVAKHPLELVLKSTHTTESCAQLLPESFGAKPVTPFPSAALSHLKEQQAKEANRKQHCHPQQQQLPAEGLQAH